MPDPYIGEIRLMAFSPPPKGWAWCNGQLLPIRDNRPLFSLLGVRYGGDGQNTFGLPDLRGRVPVHVGLGRGLGEEGGEAQHRLTPAQLPVHTHVLSGAAAAPDAVAPGGNVLAQVDGLYGPAQALTTLDPTSAGVVGGGQPHQNLQPYLAVQFCIALQGLFPSRP